ncbi:hypothetical protein KEM56_004511, partial [Ascosphaera pollenicola]
MIEISAAKVATSVLAGLGIYNMIGLFKKNQFVVEGKTIVITGGSDGLGKSIAMHLSHKGANVIIVARNKKKLDEAIQDIESAAVNPAQQFLAISADLTNPDEAERAINEATAFNKDRAPDI